VVELTGFAVETLSYMQPFDRFSHLWVMVSDRTDISMKELARWFAVGMLCFLLVNLKDLWKEVDLVHSPIVRIVSQFQYAQQTPVKKL
jgi:hypothetical protein